MVTDFSPLKAILSGSIILQTENAEKYQEKIDGSWNATIRTCKPCAFVKVASVSDVVSTVKFCVKKEVKNFLSYLGPDYMANFNPGWNFSLASETNSLKIKLSIT